MKLKTNLVISCAVIVFSRNDGGATPKALRLHRRQQRRRYLSSTSPAKSPLKYQSHTLLNAYKIRIVRHASRLKDAVAKYGFDFKIFDANFHP
jgi:hypothetical protein